MKNKLLTLVTGVVLTTVAVSCGIGCLISGMLLEGSILPVVLVAMLSSLFSGFCLQRRLSYVPAMVLGAAGLLLWFFGPLNRSAEYLIWYISSLYDVGYGWGIVRWSQEDLLHASSTVALCYGASWLALAVVRSVVKQKSSLLGTVAVLLPLLPCLVLTDTVPGVVYLFGVLLCFGILLLTQTVRSQNHAQANRLTALLAAPLALALVLLLLLCPQSTYTGQAGAEKLEELVTSWFDVKIEENPIPKPPVKLSVAADVSATEVELTQVGPQNPGFQVTLQVQAEKTGTLYLRGSAYDHYDGAQWAISSGHWSRDGEFAPAAGKELTATILTNEPHKLCYLAYSPIEKPDIQNGRVENADSAAEYTIRYGAVSGYQRSWEELPGTVPGDMQMYLALPENTAAEAREYLRTSVGFPKEGMTAGDIFRYATTVSALVRNSASYDLNTPAMPADAEDFALWFLQESDTGYCVHYASAAAVLLRAAGIPARYVSGYLVKTQADQTVNVRHKDAHAWVEYYIPGIGWMMLEATASGGDSPVVVETQPPETTLSEETTLTEETTAATDPESAGTETTPSSTGEPQKTDSQETEPQPTPEAKDHDWLGAVLLTVAGIAVVLMQWRLRVMLRRQENRRGKANARALRLWREVALCAKLLGVKPDSHLHALAQKAKFSQEIITSAELRQFDESLENSRKLLKKKPIWNQLIYTLIFALY